MGSFKSREHSREVHMTWHSIDNPTILLIILEMSHKPLLSRSRSSQALSLVRWPRALALIHEQRNGSSSRQAQRVISGKTLAGSAPPHQ